MIAIVNVGPYDDPDPLGERTYEVRINQDVIATFKHRRGDGLEKCLLRAAVAVKERRLDIVEQLVAALTKDSAGAFSIHPDVLKALEGKLRRLKPANKKKRKRG